MTNDQYRRICSDLRTICLLLGFIAVGVWRLVFKLAPPDWLSDFAWAGF